MAAKKSQRLQPVLKMAERNRQMAEQALARAKQQLMEEQDKLQQLFQLVGDYESKARGQQTQGVQAAELIRMQQFLSKMQQAISQQKEQVVISEQMLQQATGLWQLAQGRYQAMDSLISKHKTAELQAEDKRLQKSIDELVQMRHARSQD